MSKRFKLISVIFLMIMTCVISSCDKTAENTNKPVIINGFEFTVAGVKVTPDGVLQVEPGQNITIKVLYTDPDAGDNPDPGWYSFIWMVELIGAGISPFDPNQYFISSNQNPAIWTSPDVPGSYRFTVEVRDRYQTPKQQTLVIQVSTNKSPVISSIEIPGVPPAPYINQLVTIKVSAYDPDGNIPLKYTWLATGGYFTKESDGEATWLSPAAGNFVITIVVSDQAGGSTSRDIPMIVQANHAPIINGWDLKPGDTVTANQIVTITLDVADSDGDTLEYNWSSDKGTFNSVTKNIAQWRAPNEAAIAKITVTVDDQKGGTDSAEIMIVVN